MLPERFGKRLFKMKSKSKISLESLRSKILALFWNLDISNTEAATRGVLCEKMFLEISQNSQENTCAMVSFLIKLQASGTLAQVFS